MRRSSDSKGVRRWPCTKISPIPPHANLAPSIRWFPADEALRETTMDKLMPPLVPAPKMVRLKQWCEDINRADSGVTYDFVYVDEESFKKYAPRNFSSLLKSFREFK